MTRRTNWLVGAAVLAIWASAGEAGSESRPCREKEETEGTEQLEAIEDDAKRVKALMERHLPFGRHEGRHAAEGGPRNEKLLVQAGYVTLHVTIRGRPPVQVGCAWSG